MRFNFVVALMLVILFVFSNAFQRMTEETQDQTETQPQGETETQTEGKVETLLCQRYGQLCGIGFPSCCGGYCCQYYFGCQRCEAIKSKDWEQVRNKRFQEEEFLWNDSQFIIKGNQEYLKTQQDIQIQHNQGIQQGQVSEQDYSQRKSLSFRNQNSRRLQDISKYCSSRSRTIEIDVQNLNETSRINQIQELTAIQDQRGEQIKQTRIVLIMAFRVITLRLQHGSQSQNLN
ncbi:hypothetical protein ABPG72_006517 [Tetrahymena utriculariae]